jgi:hypothetical protein
MNQCNKKIRMQRERPFRMTILQTRQACKISKTATNNGIETYKVQQHGTPGNSCRNASPFVRAENAPAKQQCHHNSGTNRLANQIKNNNT